VHDGNNAAIDGALGCYPHFFILVEGYLLTVDLILEVESAANSITTVEGYHPARQFAFVEVSQNFSPEGCEDDCSTIEDPIGPVTANDSSIFQHEHSFPCFDLASNYTLEEIMLRFETLKSQRYIDWLLNLWPSSHVPLSIVSLPSGILLAHLSIAKILLALLSSFGRLVKPLEHIILLLDTK
jgi:hypothetical protein